jgi:hypothetical protein
VVLAVALGGSDDPHEFDPAPAACIERWNSDQAALALGRHQSGAHGYYELQVLTLSNDGADVAPPGPGASCAVVFAAGALDPEPIAAAQIERRGAWIPLSRLTSFNRLATLQSEAQSAYNARIGPDGRIEAL